MSCCLAAILTALAAFVLLGASDAAAGEPLSLTMIYPPQYASVNNTSMAVVGTTAPNATVNVTVIESWGEGRHRTYYGKADGNGSFSVTVELYEDNNELNVTVSDPDGRSASAVTFIVCDTHLPDVEVYRPPVSPFYTNATNYTIIVQQTCMCQYWVSIGGVEVLMTGVARRTVDLVEGENGFEVKAWDRVNNTIVFRVVIVRDTSPPVLEPHWPADDEVVTGHSLLRFNGSVTGALWVNVTLNGISHPAEIEPGDPSAKRDWHCDLDLGAVDGGWVATVRATDLVGNTDVETVRLVLDTTPPLILLEYANATRAPSVEINGRTERGVGTVRVDDQDYAVADGVFSVLRPLGHGWNLISVSAEDQVGNCCRTLVKVFYSARPPILEIVEAAVLGNGHGRILGRTDPYVREVRVGSATFPVVNRTFDATVNLAKGENRLTVSVEDPAGVTRDERITLRNGVPGSGVLAPIAGMAAVSLLIRASGRAGRGPRWEFRPSK